MHVGEDLRLGPGPRHGLPQLRQEGLPRQLLDAQHLELLLERARRVVLGDVHRGDDAKHDKHPNDDRHQRATTDDVLEHRATPAR